MHNEIKIKIYDYKFRAKQIICSTSIIIWSAYGVTFQLLLSTPYVSIVRTPVFDKGDYYSNDKHKKILVIIQIWNLSFHLTNHYLIKTNISPLRIFVVSAPLVRSTNIHSLVLYLSKKHRSVSLYKCLDIMSVFLISENHCSHFLWQKYEASRIM